MNTSVTAIDPNTVIVSWSPPLNSSQCIDHYVVSIVNGNTISNKNTSNSSTTLVITQLIQGMNYSFSVTGVDRAERTGEESETARIIMDGECIDYWLCDIYILGKSQFQNVLLI